MAVPEYRWGAVDEFRNRTAELRRLESWWSTSDREPLNLYGRRRVGKSWLFRRFAHGKPAVILVADQATPGQQLHQMSAALEPVLGHRPQLDDVADLIRVLYRLAGKRKVLAVIDEFPNLIGTTTAEQARLLSKVQAVMEDERDDSRLKLVLTGSAIGQMEALQHERNPLHGRLVPFELRPLGLTAATELMRPGLTPAEQLTTYAVAGGMPRYLTALGHRPLLEAIAERVVDRDGTLFDEPRVLLQTELREPATYFSILSVLARGPMSAPDVANEVGLPTKELAWFLSRLEDLHLAGRRLPAGATATARSTQWFCTDHFVRFWFAFVHPFQDELEAGADPRGHVKAVVAPALADHCAFVFEQAVEQWMRATYAGRVTQVGGWWGNARHDLRRQKVRQREEIDAVAVQGRKVVAVAEAKWTTKVMGAEVLTDLDDYKLPALAQDGLTVDRPHIVLASRSGFSARLRELAADRAEVRLIDTETVLSASPR
jgi:uncharacterized protein